MSALANDDHVFQMCLRPRLDGRDAHTRRRAAEKHLLAVDTTRNQQIGRGKSTCTSQLTQSVGILTLELPFYPQGISYHPSQSQTKFNRHNLEHYGISFLLLAACTRVLPRLVYSEHACPC